MLICDRITLTNDAMSHSTLVGDVLKYDFCGLFISKSGTLTRVVILTQAGWHDTETVLCFNLRLAVKFKIFIFNISIFEYSLIKPIDFETT